MRCLTPLPVILLLATGCAATTRNLAEEATAGAVEGSVDSLTARDKQEQIVGSLDEDLVEEATDRVVGGVVDGTLRSFDDPARREALREELQSLAATFGGMGKQAMGDAIDETLARLSKPENRGALRTLVNDVTVTAVDGATERARTELAGVDTSLLGPLARDLTKNAMLGVQDAIAEAQERKRSGAQPADQGNVLAAAGEAVKEGPDVLVMTVAGLGGFGLALLLTILWASRKQRHMLRELHRRDDALLGLVAAMSGRSDRPSFGELESALASVLERRRGRPTLQRDEGH